MDTKNKKLTLFLIIFTLIFIGALGISIYFLFFAKCPYEIRTNIIDWLKQPCPYVINGVIIDQISKEAVTDVVISFPKGEVHSANRGEFLIKTRGELNKIIISKDEYHTKELDISISEESLEVNLGKIFLEPEAKIIGTIIDWVSEKPLSDVILSFGKGKVKSSSQGEFIIKTSKDIDREDINKIIINKEGYHAKEIDILIAEDDREINLGRIFLLPEGRVLYQKEGSIFTANFDGSESRKLADGELLTISSTYDKFIFRTKDSALRLMDINGTNEMKFAYQVPPVDRPTFTTLSQNGKIVAWIASHFEEEIIYFNFELDKQDSVRQLFKSINTFSISPDGKYIAVVGNSFQDRGLLHLEDIISHQTILQIHNTEDYFFDEENLYYNVINSSWFVYNFQDGKTNSFDLEPAWWENKFTGIINPYTKDKMLVGLPVSTIGIADAQGLNAKRILKMDFPGGGFLGGLKWLPNEKYILFKTFQSPYPYKISLWILDINSGAYKKIIDEIDDTRLY